MKCPNLNHPDAKALIAKIGMKEFFKEYIKNNEEIPDPESYSNTISGLNTSMKIIEALSNSEGLYNRFYTSNPEKFYHELIQLAGKDQVAILKQWNLDNSPQSIMDMITGVLADASYTIGIEKGSAPVINSIIDNDGTEESFLLDGTEYHNDRFTGEFWYYNAQGDHIPLSKNDYKIARKKVQNSVQNTPSNYYRNMTVPGGTNYSEHEIYVPGVVPSIQGHAQFSSPEGIGWFRSDEQASKGGNQIEELGEDPAWSGTKQLFNEDSSAEGSNTRRVLELQSDLFQKGRDRDTLSIYTGYLIYNDRRQLYGRTTTKEESDEQLVDMKKKFPDEVFHLEIAGDNINQFLQLLNKNSNWVSLFIKSIIQDSARQGYKKVRFPSGDTASKVEGHETLEQFRSNKLAQIKDIDSQIEETKKYLDQSELPVSYRYVPYSSLITEEEYNKIRSVAEKQGFIESKDLETGESAISLNDNTQYFNYPSGATKVTKDIVLTTDELGPRISYNFGIPSEGAISPEKKLEGLEREKKTYQIELSRIETEGIAALRPVYSFYETRIKNTLKKSYAVESITDEYNNTWNEVTIAENRDLETIYFQKDTKQEDVSQLEKEKDSEINSLYSNISLNFVTDDSILDRKVKEQVTSRGQSLSRQTTIRKKQESIKSEFEELRDLIKCING